MSLGGGTFVSENKVLPGAYINFVGLKKADAQLSDRGVVTMPLELNWGADGEVMEVDLETLLTGAKKIFGYDYTAPELADIRDIFKNANKLYAYRLNAGGQKASNTFAEARYSGIRGNDLTITIAKNADNAELFDVSVLLDGKKVDGQMVASAADLQANDYVTFKNNATLTENAGIALSGGTNGTVSGDSHSDYLAKMESYNFNAMGVKTNDNTIKALYVAYAKRMRDTVGSKFQCVLYNQAADYEGIVNVKNTVDIIPWTVGLLGGCAVNKSCSNRVYDGEAEVSADYTQAQLEQAIKNGEFTLHKVGDKIKVLTDINSLTTITNEKGEIFKSNQSIRVMDQIANSIASLFAEKYLGIVPNNADGRISLWNDIVRIHQQLNDIGAIEDFNDQDIIVIPGSNKNTVVVNDAVTLVNAMEKLYMTVTVA